MNESTKTSIFQAPLANRIVLTSSKNPNGVNTLSVKTIRKARGIEMRLRQYRARRGVASQKCFSCTTVSGLDCKVTSSDRLNERLLDIPSWRKTCRFLLEHRNYSPTPENLRGTVKHPRSVYPEAERASLFSTDRQHAAFGMLTSPKPRRSSDLKPLAVLVPILGRAVGGLLVIPELAWHGAQNQFSKSTKSGTETFIAVVMTSPMIVRTSGLSSTGVSTHIES